ncbi:MAG: hypothetical protein J6Z31_10540, partial [Fibrobacter sp.]|nr:hypothetical protein [Fibrobacter sp.]
GNVESSSSSSVIASEAWQSSSSSTPRGDNGESSSSAAESSSSAEESSSSADNSEESSSSAEDNGESSSSAEESSSSSEEKTVVTVPQAPVVLEGGDTYEIETCGGNTGVKTVQLSGDHTECLEWFADEVEWNTDAWWGACKGQLSASFPLTVTVPENTSLEITACW